MPIPTHWDAFEAITACPVIPWEGRVWRIHKQRYPATDPGGSRKVSGRYHRGGDRFPDEAIWSALYLATNPEICLAELFRHITPEVFPSLNSFRLSQLDIRLAAVLDCRDPARLTLSLQDLVHDTDYRITQNIGAAAYTRGLEGILAPSATRLGDNVIVFPTQLGESSHLSVTSSRDPRLRPIQ